MVRQTHITRPLTGRPLPIDTASWEDEPLYLMRAGENSLKTETTYRSGLRLFADWLQHFGKGGFEGREPWPLSPAELNNDVILQYRQWLVSNRSTATVNTYMAALIGYLIYLEERDRLPTNIQIGKLQRQLRKRRPGTSMSDTVVDLDEARQQIPQIVSYYQNLPIPAENDTYNRRLTILRDRALVNVLYSTAARISEIVSLNRSKVDHGHASYALVTGKGNKNRTIHFRDYAQQSIRAYLRERSDHNQALFVSHSRNSNGARLTINSVHQVVKRAVKDLRLHRSLSAHDFRHFRATQLLREGMPIEVVQEFLGHADIATTRNIYAPVLGVQIVTEWLDNVDIPPEQAKRK